MTVQAIRLVTVCGQLKTTKRSVLQLPGELVSGLWCALAEVPGQKDFCIPLDRRVAIPVAGGAWHGGRHVFPR